MQGGSQGKARVSMSVKMAQKITWNQMRVAQVRDNCQVIIWTQVIDKDATIKNVSFTFLNYFTYFFLLSLVQSLDVE